METGSKALFFSSLVALTTIFILLTGPLVVVQNLTTTMVQIFGVLLILWAIIAKHVNKTEHTHKLPSGYFYATKGPYEIIRHPVYAGFLLIMTSIVQYEFTFLRVVAFVILIVVILLKIVREEKTMEREVKSYQEYQLKTKRIIPYLF